MRLSERPDWLYLLRDFDAVYQLGRAGGSKPIRAHQRKVRERIARVIACNPEFSDRLPESKPVLTHFGRAIDNAVGGPLAALARAIDRIDDQLCWEWGYDRLAPKLAERYAYCEMAGPRGPVVSEDLILGLVLFAPGTIYPQHAHSEIEESYISISGAWSENDTAVYAPGSLILNRSDQQHRITVGDAEPCLLAYAWVGALDRLRDPQMKFSKTRKAGGQST